MGKVEINRDAILAARGADGPCVMVNLFRLKDNTQFAEFLQAMRSVAGKAIDTASAETLYAGAMGGEFIAGEDHWDRIVLVRYPNWQTLCDSLADDELVDKVNNVRRKYLDDARFILTTALGGSNFVTN